MADVSLAASTSPSAPSQVLHDIDLEVKDGEFVVFVGPSGCGKSTLLRLIAGLEKVTSGEIADRRRAASTTMPPAERKIAMVFQSYALYPHMSVYRNMAFGLKFTKAGQGRGRPPRPRRRRDPAAHALSRPQAARPLRRPAPARRHRPRHRARAEPSSSSTSRSPTSTRRSASTRASRSPSCTAQLAATTIYVTHDQVEAMTLATKIVVINQGRIEQIGAPLDLYHRPANLFVAGFIGSPRMNFVKASVLHVDRAGITVSTITGRETTIAVAPGVGQGRRHGHARRPSRASDRRRRLGPGAVGHGRRRRASRRVELHLSPSRRRHRHHRAHARRQPGHPRHAPHRLRAKRGDPRLRQFGKGDAAAAVARAHIRSNTSSV